MQYFVSFTIFLNSDVEHDEQEVKEFIKDQLDSAGVTIENTLVEKIKHI